MDKWRVWDNTPEYGEVLFKRAIGLLPEMECSKKIARELDKYVQDGDRILDVGCGSGHYLRSLRREIQDRSFYYTGVDATKEYVNFACKAFPDDNNCDFQVGDIFDLRLQDSSYDVVMCNNLLLHLPSIKKPIAELVRVARRNVVVRMLAGQRSFQIKDVAPQDGGQEFDDAGEPKSFHYYNIYSTNYLNKLLSENRYVKEWSITPDFDFNKENISMAAKDNNSPYDATSILGDFQVNGYILQPWVILEIEVVA